MGYQKSVMDLCRLCSCTDQIFNVFHSHLDNGEQLRYSILLATGIKIKPTDEVSKMVCHRCCEIALKLHKYRNNAVANDKLLKERCGQPYSPPITDQHELLCVASQTVSQETDARNQSIIVEDDDDLGDPLEILNLCIEKQILHKSSSNPFKTQHSHNETSAQFSADVSLNHPTHNSTVNTRPSEDLHSHNQRQTKRAGTTIIEETPVSKQRVHINNKIATFSAINITDQQSLLGSSQNIENSGVTVNSCKIVPKMRYKHPSVRELFKTFKGIMLPEKAFKSDVSPVISLDRAEVNDWYKNQLKQKLPSVVIKKVPNSSNYTISSSLLTSSEHTAAHSSKQAIATASDTSIVTLPELSEKISPFWKHKLNPNYRRIIPTNDFDFDAVIGDKMFNYDHQKENDMPQLTPQASVANLHATTAAATLAISENQRITTLIKNANSHKKGNTKKNNARRSRVKRKRTHMDDNDLNEIIPEKRKRIYCNKNALKTHNKMDLPQVCPSDKNEQKAIFTSSLELRPVKPLSSLKSTCAEPLPLAELTPVEPLTDLEPRLLPELVTRTTRKIFLCPVCNEVYNTKKQLTDHESIHLKCKFCNKIVENAELLKQHQNESCFASIANNKPFIKLKRVDTVPSIVEQYTQAFEVPNISIPTESGGNLYCSEFIDYSELDLNIEEIVLPAASGGSFSGIEEIDQNFGSANRSGKNSQLATTESLNSAVVYDVSDDSNDEIECIEISAHKIIENPYFSSITNTEVLSRNTCMDVASNEETSNSTQLNKQLDKSKYILKSPPISDLSEKEMIRHLFKKYSPSPSKSEGKSQTFTSSNDNIAFPKSHLITVDHMFTELFTNRVPIHLECGPEISATFKERASTVEQNHPVTLECWAHKKIVYIEKPRAVRANCPPLSVPTNDATISSNVVSTPTYILPKMLKPTTNTNKTLVIKKSTALMNCISNVAYIKKSCNSSSTVPIVTCALSTGTIQQGPTLVTKSLNTDVVSSKVDALGYVVRNNSAVNSTCQQQLSSPTQPNGTNSIQINTAVAATTDHQCNNINSIVPNACTERSAAANSTFSVSSPISVTSANNLCDIASACKVTYTGSTYLQQPTNFIQIQPLNSAAVPRQNTVISQNNAPVILQSHQGCYEQPAPVANTATVIPLAMPGGPANNLFNVTPVSTMKACSTSYQPRYTNFMQVVEPQISAEVPHEAAVVTIAETSNNTNVGPYTIPLTPTNNMYGVTSSPTMVKYSNAQLQMPTNYVNITKWANATAFLCRLTAGNNNISNMNAVTGTNTMQTLPLHRSNNRYETSFLYNADPNLSLSREHSNPIGEIGSGNQSNKDITESNAQPVHNSMLRVKTVRELS